MPIKTGKLTPTERAFVSTMAATGDRTYSAKKAGYAGVQVAGSRNMSNPAIVAAIYAEQQKYLYGDLRQLALNTIQSVLSDAKAPVTARIQAAKVVLDKTDKAPDEAGSKGLAEMSVEELTVQLERARAALDAMRDVTPSATIDLAPEPPRPENDPKEVDIFE